MNTTNFSIIPIMEANSNRIAGSFCSTMDAVTKEELAALQQLRELTGQAKEVKRLLKTVEGNDERLALEKRLESLRTEATTWQARREQTTLEKNVRLGHAILPVADPRVG
ncbi:MAG: hypothetical protein HQL76_14715 [Magnetococcales bacterium]|nr:hypothetical protein [Magnetococcales bacterium]